MLLTKADAATPKILVIKVRKVNDIHFHVKNQVQSIADAALTEQNDMISGRQRARGAQNGRFGGYAGILHAKANIAKIYGTSYLYASTLLQPQDLALLFYFR